KPVDLILATIGSVPVPFPPRLGHEDQLVMWTGASFEIPDKLFTPCCVVVGPHCIGLPDVPYAARLKDSVSMKFRIISSLQYIPCKTGDREQDQMLAKKECRDREML
ncbi:unnamed protein product, partial [Allacma fusca]